MRIFKAESWLRSPLDRDVIARWTVGADRRMQYALDLPPPPDPTHFTFLALGDTGDSEAAGPHRSPQDAVAQEMAEDAALPNSAGVASCIVHTGDVIYMTGERRLYERNFRRPYTAFLAPESTIDNLIFRLPFLPVPGNHDYYDLGIWARWLSRIPMLGTGVRAIAHEMFAFSLPKGGSEMGRAYMQAFVDLKADTSTTPLPYRPCEQTRIPNRYYKFRIGDVDFFALDSNTLEAPALGTNTDKVKADAAHRIKELEAQANALDRQMRHDQLALDRWRTNYREEIARTPDRLSEIAAVTVRVGDTLTRLRSVLPWGETSSSAYRKAADAIVTSERRWTEAVTDMNGADEPQKIVRALQGLEEASDDCCNALSEVEACLATLPNGTERDALLAASNAVQQALHEWSVTATQAPEELTTSLHRLSEETLDIQREMALEKRRLQYRASDYDSAQLDWLERSLAESVRERPHGWRVVYMHHPLYTTIANHCERPDVQGLRENLSAILQSRVHLVLSGHSHAFEWFRSDLLPFTGIFVTGGGGMVSLRPSLLAPRRWYRNKERYRLLRTNGAVECAMGGRGPAAPDGQSGLLYHYLRIEVTPDALRIHPIGVRRITGNYRREEPMPVFHASELPATRPPWKSRLLKWVEVRRDQPPTAYWSE